MNDLISIGIVVLALFIQALLQLTPGVFTLWCHYALARNSKNKVLDMSGYFAVGIEVTVVLVIMTIYFAMLGIPDLSITKWIFAGILVALGIFAFLGYYRKGDGTELFISRKSAEGFYKKAKAARKKSDIFLLGVVTYISELFLTLPLVIVVIMQMPFFGIWWQVAILAFYVMSTMTSLGVVRGKFLRDRNLVDIQKTRVKNKNIYRTLIGCCYILMAILLVLAEVLK